VTSARILVLGAGGQLAADVVPILRHAGHSVVTATRADVDICEPEQLAAIFDKAEPKLVINCAAFNDVDGAEDDRQASSRANADAPRRIGDLAAERDAAVIHFSTDYVFDGLKPGGYTEDDEPNPVSWYGRTKLEGERGLLSSGASAMVLRVSWLYRHTHNNFLTKMLALGRQRSSLRVVNDQVGCPGYTADVALAVLAAANRIVDARAAGAPLRSRVYHVAAPDSCSRFEFADAIFRWAMPDLLPRQVELLPCGSDAFATKAKRPLNSRLDSSRFAHEFGFQMPSWRDGLRSCFSMLRSGQP
jgi:dTDP-4-dehydrorhamnose reductase